MFIHLIAVIWLPSKVPAPSSPFMSQKSLPALESEDHVKRQWIFCQLTAKELLSLMKAVGLTSPGRIKADLVQQCVDAYVTEVDLRPSELHKILSIARSIKVSGTPKRKQVTSYRHKTTEEEHRALQLELCDLLKLTPATAFTATSPVASLSDDPAAESDPIGDFDRANRESDVLLEQLAQLLKALSLAGCAMKLGGFEEFKSSDSHRRAHCRVAMLGVRWLGLLPLNASFQMNGLGKSTLLNLLLHATVCPRRIYPQVNSHSQHASRSVSGVNAVPNTRLRSVWPVSKANVWSAPTVEPSCKCLKAV